VTVAAEPEEDIIEVIEVVEEVKKPRKSRNAVTPVVEVPSSSSLGLATPVEPPSTSKRARIVKMEDMDQGADAEMEDETTPVSIAADRIRVHSADWAGADCAKGQRKSITRWSHTDSSTIRSIVKS